MNRALARLLTSLYPRHWRIRYGPEFQSLLQSSPIDFRSSINVIGSALYERIFPTPGLQLDQPPRSFSAIMKQPSAFLPLAMSLTALTLVLIHVAIFGAHREPDEGPTAHLWQLLMAAQTPVIAFFAIKWLPRAPKQSLFVLAEQAGAALASVATVFFSNL